MLLLAYAIVLFFSYRYYKEKGFAAAISYALGMQVLFLCIGNKLLPIWIIWIFAIGLGLVISGFDNRIQP